MQWNGKEDVIEKFSKENKWREKWRCSEGKGIIKRNKERKGKGKRVKKQEARNGTMNKMKSSRKGMEKEK